MSVLSLATAELDQLKIKLAEMESLQSQDIARKAATLVSCFTEITCIAMILCIV